MSENVSKKRLRSGDHIFLIESSAHQIVGSKLPSNKQVLEVFFFNKSRDSDVNKCARLVIDEVIIFWQKARIPTHAIWWCVKKVKDLYEKWKSLQKSSTRRTEIQMRRETEFLNTLDDLFDIAASDALTQMKNKEDQDFLIAQREKGRKGSLLGINLKEQKREEEKQERIDAEEKRKQAAEAEKLKYSKVQYDFGEDENEEYEQGDDDVVYVPDPSQVRINKRNIYTVRLIAALDKCKVSDRDAIHLIAAILHALGLDINHYVLCRSSLMKFRTMHRKQIALQFLQDVKVFTEITLMSLLL